jgi:biotin-dependent carboxylase-like uncharacterized protein
LQDLGRRGFQHLGFAQGGAADEHAFLWANKLLNNKPGSCALEITLGPFAAEFDGPARMAVTGACTEVWINDIAQPSWQTITVAAGDSLKIKPARHGLRSYLAIYGGFIADTQLGSQSMVMREKTGPFLGGPLTVNTPLSFTAGTLPPTKAHTQVPSAYIPDYSSHVLDVHLLPSYQYPDFSADARHNFFAADYAISADSNRMGYCLSGPTIAPPAATLLSEGIAFGSVQIPPSGQAIILLKDRQTIGGYAKIGCVSHLDCFRLSQRRPGQKVRFVEGSIEDAQKALRRFYNFFL